MQSTVETIEDAKQHGVPLPFKSSPKNSRGGRSENRQSRVMDRIERIASDTEGDEIQELLEVSRGCSLILRSLWNDFEERGKQIQAAAIASGLAYALAAAADKVDLVHFKSAGALATSLDDEILAGLLRREAASCDERRRARKR